MEKTLADTKEILYLGGSYYEAPAVYVKESQKTDIIFSIAIIVFLNGKNIFGIKKEALYSVRMIYSILYGCCQYYKGLI